MKSKDLGKRLAKELANRDKDTKFITGALLLMETDEMMSELLEYLEANPDAKRRDIEEEMFFMSIKDNQA